MGDPHEILGVEPGADAEGLLRAFRRQAKRHHPDLHPGDPGAPARFRALVIAYQVLSRARLAAARVAGKGHAVEVSCLASGADLYGSLVVVDAPAEPSVLVAIDALWPCLVCDGLGEERIAAGWGRVERWECETCRGAGVRRLHRLLRVYVPSECPDGGRLRLAGMGLPRAGGGSGDVILVVRRGLHTGG
jgi:molecular chaperone DnaJ